MQDGPIEIVQFLRFLDGLGDGWPAIIVLGLLAGFVARMATSRQQKVGLLSVAVLGIAGALLGVWAAKALGIALTGTGTRFLAALVGSLALALVGGLFVRKAPRTGES